jgi:hypothetical protein
LARATWRRRCHGQSFSLRRRRNAASQRSQEVTVLFLSIFLAAWFAIGAVAVAVMRHRGHDAFAWAVPFFFLGPLALPVALSSDRHRPAEPAASSHEGRLDVLIAHDGSADATTAASAALDLLGAEMTSVTFAAVLDLEATSTVRGREAQHEAEIRLDALVRELAGVTRVPVETVILLGEPIQALQHFGSQHGYELIVAGAHVAGHRGVRQLATKSPVPVLLGPPG